MSRIGNAPSRLKLEQHQRLVSREGERVRAEQPIELAQQDLLHAHDRGDGCHGSGITEPALPGLGSPGDRIERQI